MCNIKPNVMSNDNTLIKVEMRFERTRKSRSKLLSYYITSAVFSVLSLISYSIKIDIVPGRMGMLTVLYLIQINTYSSVKAPLNRGLSLIEKWFIGMQVTIIIAIQGIPASRGFMGEIKTA